MKKYVLTIILSALASMADAQLFSPMGKGIYQEPILSAVDSRGNVAVIVGNKSDRSSDSLLIYMYDKAKGEWTYITKYGPVDIYSQNQTGSCVFVKDTLYVLWQHGQTYRNKVLQLAGTQMRDFVTTGPLQQGIVTILSANDKLIVAGGFDSLMYDGKVFKVKNQAYLQNNTWKSCPVNNHPYQFVSNMANLNDTVAFINTPGIIRYTPDGYYNEIPFSLTTTNGWSYHISTVSNKFVITREGNDTLVILSGNKITKVKAPEKVGKRPQFAGLESKYFANLGTKYLYQWNLNNNQFTRILKISRNSFKLTDSTIRNLSQSDSHVFFYQANTIDYMNKTFGNVAIINYDSAETFKNDTVHLFLYYDKNKNLSFDSGDEQLNVSSFPVRNATYNELVAGDLDLIPEYADCEYEGIKEIKHNGICLKLTFSGYLRSKIMRPGVTRDTLRIPYQEYNSNLFVLGSARPRHRLWSTSTVIFTVGSNLCDGNTNPVTLKILPPPKCTVLKSRRVFTRKSGDTLIYEFYPNFMFGDHFELDVAYDTTYHKVGDTVSFKAWLTAQQPDDQSDNYAVFRPVLVYSYDPNRKYSIPEGRVTRGLKEIQYHIDFENEGNDYAERVIIKDTLDTRVPVYAFQMVKASHPYKVSLQGNVVTWTFDNIYLTPKKQDSVKSKGFVNFVARINSSLREGDSIRNRASIYFDYNKPIITNFAVLFFPYGHTGSTTEVIRTAGWSLFPNPAEDVLTIGKLQGLRTFEIFDMQGRSVWKHEAQTREDIQIPVGTWSRGVYMMVDSEGTARKFILR